MKKRPYLSAVSGRTCPHCLIIIDPVFYGWHVGKCSSSKLGSTLKQDMAPRTPVKIEAADNAHFREAPIHVVFPREAPALAPDSRMSRLPSSRDTIVQSLNFSNEELDHLWEENQTLKTGLKLKSEENEALNDKLKELECRLEEKTGKVKSLELKLEDLEVNLEDLKLQVKLVKEAENKAACLLDREKIAQGTEMGVCSQPSESGLVKSLGLVNGSSADAGVGNSHFCERQVEVVDSVRENGVEMDSARSDNAEKKLDLDRVVDLACGECAISQEFVSHVEGLIKAKEAVPSIINTSRKQRILSGMFNDASNEDEKQEVSGKGNTPCGADFDDTNLQNEFSPKVKCLSSHTSKPFQSVVDEDVSCLPLVPRSSMGKQCFRDNSIDIGFVKVNKDILAAQSPCKVDMDAHGIAPLGTQHHAAEASLYAENPKPVPSPHVPLEDDADLNVKQMMKAQSCSSSASTECKIYAAKAKSGFRRMVLPSDSESDSGTSQGIHSGKKAHEPEICEKKKHTSPPRSSYAEGEKSEGFFEDSREKRKCTSCKASQPYLRRSKRLNMVCTSDQSDDATCKGQGEESNCRRAKAAVIDLEGDCEDDNPDKEHAGVRRSKRLRGKSFQKVKDSLKKESMHLEKSISSGDETNANVEGFEESESRTSSSVHSEAPKVRLKRKRPSRTRKRLFEDVESRPLKGNKHDSDSEDDNSEIDSDDDSLKGFITESEGIESTGYSSEHHSSSSSYSLREVFGDPKLTRDIKKKSYVWELEGEMLAMFAVDPELCLRAVCALNRRQTEDEQKEKTSKYTNKRGFDTSRAARGSRLAEFLTNGDIFGPVKKSPEDLKKYDAGGLKFCEMLASHHSKQLFEMYMNDEDPYFPFA